MAAIADPQSVKMVTVAINDVEIQVPEGELIVETVKRLGLEIPIFCYHPRMKPVGMCRMCLVEVGFKQKDGSIRKMPKPQAGCTLPASEGMVVYTDTEMVHRDRKGVLEFLLINHPLDCPICDRGGECPLQNNTLFYGPSTSRYIDLKRHMPKAYPLSEFVTLDLERCIQCGRCVRFTEEISGDSQLAFRFRGAAMQPSTFKLTHFDSKFSGNTIEICPVGALTSAKYRFRARPWDIETKPSICTTCSNGCSVWMDSRAGKFVRMNGRTNEAVNEEWTCDRGKFGQGYLNSSSRTLFPAVRNGEAMAKSGWAEAYEAISRGVANGPVGMLLHASIPNEGLYLAQKLMRVGLRSNNIDHRWRLHSTSPDWERLLPLEAVEKLKTLLVFGSSLADEAPILYLRVRKAWFRYGLDILTATQRPTELDEIAGQVRPATSGLLAAARNASEWEDLLREGPAGIVATREILNDPEGADALAELRALAERTGASLSLYATEATEQGALDLGVLPDLHAEVRKAYTQVWGAEVPATSGMDTRAMLEAAANGSLGALWLVGCDPFELWPDRDLVTRALENVPFLVVQSVLDSEASQYASVILPMAANAEQAGTFTNLERRVQRANPSVRTPGEAKEAWRIFAELLQRITPGDPYFGPGDVLAEIARACPAYGLATEEALGGEGALLE